MDFFQENGKKLKQVTYLEKSIIDRREGTEGTKYLCHGKLTGWACVLGLKREEEHLCGNLITCHASEVTFIKTLYFKNTTS